MNARGTGARTDVEGFGIEQSALPPFEAGRIDPRRWFEHPERRFEIEIGCGKGTFLVQEAPRQLEVNYLGIEKAPEYWRFAADRMRRHGLRNVRILRGDAVEFLRFWCADAVAAVIHLYFSDPWPKTRHHKRRVVQEGTLHELHRVLEPGGELRLVTDHDGLWAWYEELAAGSALFERGPFEAPASAGTGEVVGSNFERKYRREGRPFHAMTLKKDREERDPGSLSFRVRKPGTDSDNVQMSDVLCDFCRREWTEDVPMIEGHQGSCLCARCLTLAYTEVVVNGSRASPGYKCPMCLEGDADREAMDRAGEPGWQSPLYPEAVICRRCIELAARQLERDEEHAWTRPSGGGHESR